MEPSTSEKLEILGIDVGGTKTGLIAGDSDGNVHSRIEFTTEPSRGYSNWLKTLADNVATFKTALPDWHPVASGISIGGPADWEHGVLLGPPNLPDWTNIPLREDVARAVGLTARWEHDGRAGALAEYRFGAGRGCRNMVFLTFGTGIGAGIILDGRIVRGANGSAGEIGHVRLRRDSGPEAYGKQGSVEAYASGTGIARLAAHLFPQRWDANASAKDIIEADEKSVPEAREVLLRSAEELGHTMAILVDLLNPECIVLGSLSRRVPEYYLDTAMQVMENEALPANARACRVLPNALEDRLQDVASLVAAMDGL